MLSYNLAYDVSALLALIVVCGALFSKYVAETEANRWFRRFVVMLTIFVVLDIATCFTISYSASVPDWANMLLNTVYYLVTALVEFGMVRYLSASIKMRSNLNNRVCYGMFALYGALLLINVPTGMLFTFTGGQYIHGPVYELVELGMYFYLIDMVMVSVFYHHQLTRRQLVCSMGFVGIITVASLLQFVLFRNTMLVCFGVTLGTLILTFTLETPDFRELKRLQESLEEEVAQQTAKATIQQRRIQQTSMEVVESLAHAIDAKDEYTNGHSTRVSEYSVLLARELGWDDDRVEDLRLAALLHDIGKIGVPDSVLSKPARLTNVEFELIKAHTTVGDEILNGVSSIKGAHLVARHHHERYDGKGYPDGLAGEDIPEEARLVCIADSYDAMTSRRVYRRELSVEAVRKELVNGRGTQFDPDMLDAFLRLFDEYRLTIEHPSRPVGVVSNLDATKGKTDAFVDEEGLISFTDLISAFQESKVPHGASQFDYGEFAPLFDLLRNMSGRYNKSLQMVLFTLEADPSLTTAEVDEVANLFEMAMKLVIRGTDVCTRFGTRQFLIVVYAADEEMAEAITARIIKGFFRAYGGGKVQPKWETATLS